MKKVILLSIIFIICMCVVTSFSYASISPDDYRPNLGDGQTLAERANVIIGALQLFGSAVSVIALIIIGIRYLLGSVEEKAEYKELMMPYIIGAVLVFSVVNLLAIIEAIMTDGN